MNTKINEILQEIESVIVGKNEIVEKILMAILAQGHVLMEDVPGVGKTTTAMAFAKVLGLETRRVQFTSVKEKRAEKQAAKSMKKKNSTNESGRVGDRPYARGRSYDPEHYGE